MSRTEGSGRTQAAPGTVLVVDDNEAVAAGHRELLVDDYEVRVAHTGREALEQVDGAVDVVLLDRQLPGLSGVDVLRMLRDRGADCRVALVSSLPPDLAVLDAEYDAYLRKPARPHALTETVTALLERQTYDRRVREFLALAERKASIETERSPGDLVDSPAYRQLVADLEAAREAATGAVDALDDSDLRAELGPERATPLSRDR